ncbi:OpcA protein [Nakamurella sp. YIM 132087]|uniref:OpcA protein n=1 Tax=Nakamurella alba TaxID=2665158 RepID=A0A7K1FI04_9ACTN|nr:glucose-6-phosphate dehydrogenase assembly protein OpcA [Nakamurella alba]MTD13757.1 OpcA protein [Nakamurella alba]
MIIDLPSTTSSSINKAMVELREKGGANAQGRVLTLVIVTDEESGEDPIAAANGASFEHPCRVLVVAKGSKRGTARMDAQIRVGGDAGASEVVILRLYGPLADHGAAVVVPLLLADAPVVVWWPGQAPDVPAEDPIGALAQRRITDAASSRRPLADIETRVRSYRPGDTDLAWTRLTMWRGLLAAALDQPPHEKITGVEITAASDSASAELLAGWLALQLRCPIKRVRINRPGTGLRAVALTRRSGEISLVRPENSTATLTVTNQPPRQLSLPRRILRDCIAEELRRLDADDVFAEVLAKGLPLLDKAPSRSAKPAKADAKKAPTKRPSRRATASVAAVSAAGTTAAAEGSTTRSATATTRPTKAAAAKAPTSKAPATPSPAGKAPAGAARTAKAPAGKARATKASSTKSTATRASATRAPAAAAAAAAPAAPAGTTRKRSRAGTTATPTARPARTPRTRRATEEPTA